MTRTLKGLGSKEGLSPGTLVGRDGGGEGGSVIDLLCWRPEEYAIHESVGLDGLREAACTWPVRWIRVRGLEDLDLISKLGAMFDIHPLQLEDALNAHDRPKAEEDENGVFASVNSITASGTGGTTSHLHLGIVLREGTVITFEEGVTPVFEAVIGRMKKPGSRLRRFGPDYLFYVIVDAVVDGYFTTLERLADEIEVLEEDLVSGDGEDMLSRIHTLRNEMLLFRRSVWPMREVAGNIERAGGAVMSEDVRPFVRDLYDHSVQVIETAEALREMLAGMLDTYLSSVNNRMSQVMKVLTIIATIFIPLTFIAGVYGMNFQYMPELGWRHGYFVVWGVMLAIGITMVILFKRKKWM